VLLLDSHWLPNRDGIDWFLDRIWPEIRRRIPQAVVHVFGDRSGGAISSGIEFHPAPPTSRDVFAPNGILVVPLRIASGVRMKILEAWSRGVPVVATPEACKGLEINDGDGVLIATSPAEYGDAVDALHSQPEMRRHQIERGRRVLAERHDPIRVAHQLDALYRDTIRRYEPRRARLA
jgi:glycosyltransferase involved in cell wall biosynthesis